ncbi:hypothetical protein MMPV_009311 [Pyropia vietnamensis]
MVRHQLPRNRRNYLGHGRDFSGRVVPEKIETQNRLFRSIFDCESNALANKSVRYTREQAHTLGRLKKDATPSFGPRSEWNGEPPLLVFQFLRKFCKACDDNDVSEAEAFYMLQDFTRDPLRTEVMAIMPSRHGGNPGEVTCYLQLINWHLRLHADEETLALQVEEFSKATQQASEDERAFSTRLRHLNVLCGFIHSKAMLKSRFVEGCHKAVRSTVRERNTPSLTLAELARIAQTKGDEYRWLREEQRKASALEYKRLAEASRAARPTRPAFVPRSTPRTRVGAVQDDDPEVAGVAQPASAKLTPTGQGVRPRDKPVPEGVDPTKLVVSLTGSNYQVATRVWLSPGYEVALRVILDTGSGVSLIRKELLPEDTEYRAVDKSTPRMYDING